MPEPTTIPHLDAQALAEMDIAIGDVVERIEALIRAQAAGRAWSAPKATFETSDGRYAMNTMAAAADPPYLITKSLLLNPRNPDAGHPLMNAIITVQDAESGAPQATMDGNWVTAVRTAALSVTAAKRLARPGAATVAFLGCGVQARHHLQALAEYYPLREVRAFGRGLANIERLCALVRDKGLAARIATTAEEALSDADIVISSITRDPATAPFIDANWLTPGTFAALTDLGAQWLPEPLAGFDTLIVDDLAQERAMKKRLVAEEQVSGDLAGLVLGKAQARQADAERTAFLFRGHALGDFAMASLVAQRVLG